MAFSRCVAPALAAISLASLAPQVRAAEDPDTLTFSASQALRYDSNLFLRSDRIQRSETLSTSGFGVELDKRYGLQRIELDANVAANRYRSNDYLNFNSLNYRAVWHWSLTPRLHGTLSRTREEEINNFDYYRNFDRNVRTEHATRGNVEANLGRDWRVLGGLDRIERNNERPTEQDGDFTLRRASVGLRRLFPSGSNISYRLLDGQGSYQNRIPGISAAPTSFDQLEHEVRLSWAATGKTTLSGRIGHVERKHPGFAVRDFSGYTGDMSVRWSATAKVGVQSTLTRGLSANQTNTNSYSTSTRFSLNPYWNVGPRTLVYVYYEHARYDFGGPLPGFAVEDRRDLTNSAALGATWKPFDSLSFAANLGHSRRTSSDGGFGYSNNSVNLNAKFSF